MSRVKLSLGPMPIGFQAFFDSLLISTLFGPIAPLISYFEDGHFTLAQIIESLRIGGDLNC